MASKIKNLIIFVVIAVVLILIYIFFIKKAPEEQNLVSSSKLNTVLSDTNTLDQNSVIAKDLLSVLLSVKSIKLDDTIFSNEAFLSLQDSSILLNPSGDEGRANPFAPIGYEMLVTPVPAPTPVNSPVVVPDTTSTTSTNPTTVTTPTTPKNPKTP